MRFFHVGLIVLAVFSSFASAELDSVQKRQYAEALGMLRSGMRTADTMNFLRAHKILDDEAIQAELLATSKSWLVEYGNEVPVELALSVPLIHSALGHWDDNMALLFARGVSLSLDRGLEHAYRAPDAAFNLAIEALKRQRNFPIQAWKVMIDGFYEGTNQYEKLVLLDAFIYRFYPADNLLDELPHHRERTRAGIALKLVALLPWLEAQLTAADVVYQLTGNTHFKLLAKKNHALVFKLFKDLEAYCLKKINEMGAENLAKAIKGYHSLPYVSVESLGRILHKRNMGDFDEVQLSMVIEVLQRSLPTYINAASPDFIFDCAAKAVASAHLAVTTPKN